MAIEIELPSFGEGITEGEIIKWLVGVGDAVAQDQPIVEVMTDKATVEIPAPRPGIVRDLRASEGDGVAVGAVLATLAEEGEVPNAEQPSGPPAAGEEVAAAPSARQAARRLGVDLREVAGTGPHGQVLRADVDGLADSGRPAGSAPPERDPEKEDGPGRGYEPIALQREEGEERIPLRGVRKQIAAAMTRSVSTAAHYTAVEEVDVSVLLELIESATSIAEPRGVRMTPLPFIMKAAAIALQEYPQFNSMLDEATQEIVRYGHVNLGIACEGEQGLIVPVVRDVDWKGVLQLASDLEQLRAKVAGARIAPEDLQGSTFSITDMSPYGGILATPIINFPEVAVLGVHRVRRRPAAIEERIEIRSLMNLAMSVDHRLVDSADACRFLDHVKKLLEHPGLLAL